MKKISMFVGIVLLLASNAFCGLVTNLKVEKVRVRPTLTYVKFVGRSQWLRLTMNNNYEKSMVAAAMNAFNNGQKLDVYFVDENASETTAVYMDLHW